MAMKAVKQTGKDWEQKYMVIGVKMYVSLIFIKMPMKCIKYADYGV